MSRARLDLLETLIDALADGVADRLREKSLAGAASEFVDQSNSPLPRRIYLRAARSGAFPSSTIERRVVAKRSDVIAWIESKRRPVKAVRSEESDSDLDVRVSERARRMGLRAV